MLRIFPIDRKAPVASRPPGDLGLVEQDVVTFFVDAANLLGVPKSVASIYGVCFAAAKPLSFAEIEQKLDLSRGSISQGLRMLRDMGALKAGGKRDGRCETFEPDLALRKLVGQFLETKLKKQLDAGGARLDGLQLLLKGNHTPEAAQLRKRLQSLQEWHRQAKALLPVASTFLKFP